MEKKPSKRLMERSKRQEMLLGRPKEEKGPLGGREMVLGATNKSKSAVEDTGNSEKVNNCFQIDAKAPYKQKIASKRYGKQRESKTSLLKPSKRSSKLRPSLIPPPQSYRPRSMQRNGTQQTNK